MAWYRTTSHDVMQQIILSVIIVSRSGLVDINVSGHKITFFMGTNNHMKKNKHYITIFDETLIAENL